MKPGIKCIVALILLLTLSACGSSRPSLGFAPDKGWVKRAIAVELQLRETQLTQQLQINDPNLEISRVKIENIEPLYIGDLPTYQVTGRYNLKIASLEGDTTQEQNPYEVYLQRQIEGKTWRLLERQAASEENSPQWLSYLIPPRD